MDAMLQLRWLCSMFLNQAGCADTVSKQYHTCNFVCDEGARYVSVLTGCSASSQYIGHLTKSLEGEMRHSPPSSTVSEPSRCLRQACTANTHRKQPNTCVLYRTANHTRYRGPDLASHGWPSQVPCVDPAGR